MNAIQLLKTAAGTYQEGPRGVLSIHGQRR